MVQLVGQIFKEHIAVEIPAVVHQKQNAIHDIILPVGGFVCPGSSTNVEHYKHLRIQPHIFGKPFGSKLHSSATVLVQLSFELVHKLFVIREVTIGINIPAF